MNKQQKKPDETINKIIIKLYKLDKKQHQNNDIPNNSNYNILRQFKIIN